MLYIAGLIPYLKTRLLGHGKLLAEYKQNNRDRRLQKISIHLENVSGSNPNKKPANISVHGLRF